MLIFAAGRLADGAAVSSSSLPGIVVDDPAAQFEGEWKPSAHVSPYVNDGYLHDDNTEKGKRSARFTPDLPTAGNYQVLIAYTPGKSRAMRVPVTITTADGAKLIYVDQRVPPPDKQPFLAVGVFRFEAGKNGSVLISNADTTGHVVVDAVQFIASKDPITSDAALASVTPPPAKPAPEPEKPAAPLPSRPARDVHQLTPAELDRLIDAELQGAATTAPSTDEQFLRRASLDLIGRQPTIEELAAFVADKATDKREQAIERLLGSPEFGRNWANYWSDAIGYRVPQPELTFLNYYPFKDWLTEKLNLGVPWDVVVREILTAKGKVGENPAATFVGFHEANPTRLAAETSRVFLGVQIQCAECHDHPFESWKREQFHRLTAFFVRAVAKAPHNDSGLIEVKDKGTGEWQMPDAKDPRKKGPPMQPGLLTGEEFELGKTDAQRREALANWVGDVNNPWFARSYVNRIWSRLLGRGFFEPVDSMGGLSSPEMPKVHEALADSFIATGCNVKELFRLVTRTQTYQRGLPQKQIDDAPAFASAVPAKLRSDQIFDSLVTAIELPNLKGEAIKPTSAVRFPPPPKSTRDIINDTFGFDPSLAPADVTRTLSQAMLMMNNEQLQAQVNAKPESGTMLSKLLTAENDDKVVIDRLFHALFARKPSEKEVQIAVNHIAELKDRGEAFEDILWSLLNSAEFTTKR